VLSWKTALLAALSLYTALLIQRSALPLLGLPGAEPLPMVVLVAAFALVRGPFVGSLIGFCGGLVADLAPPTTHGAGREAFLYCLIGYVCGMAAGEIERSALAPLAVVAFASAFAVVGNAALSLIFGAEHPSLSALATIVPSVVLYDVLLAPFIVPAIAVLVRRLDPEPRR
jgi:rod shape-determining protein MreD